MLSSQSQDANDGSASTSADQRPRKELKRTAIQKKLNKIVKVAFHAYLIVVLLAVCVYVCMYVCMHVKYTSNVCMYMNIKLYSQMSLFILFYVCIYVCMYTYVCTVCMYVYV